MIDMKLNSRIMKKSIISVCILATLTGCDSYLKETSGDLLIPGSVEEFTPLLYGEGYPHNFDVDAGWFKLMTDDVEMSHLETSNEEIGNTNSFDVTDGREGRYVYLWDYNMGEKVADGFWEARYANILGCNAVIDALPTMKYNEAEVGKYKYLAAQAYALRAYHYFCLINTYALPYSQENLNKPGVIIRTTPDIKVKPQPRASIAEVWKLINDDMQTAMGYMNESTPSANPHLISPLSLKFLASRIALFQEKWDDVIKYGEQFLQENNYILDLNAVDESKMGTTSSKDFAIMNMSENKEIIFTFGTSKQYYDYLSTYPALYSLGFRVSKTDDGSLIKAYSEGDLRLKAFFTQDYMEADYSWEPPTQKYCYNYPIKYRSAANNYHENWRTVEVYLNLAEAYARKDRQISSKAIELLNDLRSKRIKRDQYRTLTSADFKNPAELVKFIWNERRRELCFEEAMRFWDLRRTGMPRIEHRWYTDKNNYELYVLEEKGKNYVVQIPLSETSVNSLATPNDRDVIQHQ